MMRLPLARRVAAVAKDRQRPAATGSTTTRSAWSLRAEGRRRDPRGHQGERLPQVPRRELRRHGARAPRVQLRERPRARSFARLAV